MKFYKLLDEKFISEIHEIPYVVNQLSVAYNGSDRKGKKSYHGMSLLAKWPFHEVHSCCWTFFYNEIVWNVNNKEWENDLGWVFFPWCLTSHRIDMCSWCTWCIAYVCGLVISTDFFPFIMQLIVNISLGTIFLFLCFILFHVIYALYITQCLLTRSLYINITLIYVQKIVQGHVIS